MITSVKTAQTNHPTTAASYSMLDGAVDVEPHIVLALKDEILALDFSFTPYQADSAQRPA